MPVVAAGEVRTLIDAGAPAPVVVPQASTLQAVVVDDGAAALVTSETNTPLPLGTSDAAVTTMETITVL